MAVEIPISRFETLWAAFDAAPQDRTFILAGQRDPRSRLLVDDATMPSVAVIWPPRGPLAFFAGVRTPDDGALADVVRLLLSSMDENQRRGLRLAMPFPEWSASLARTFGHAFAPRERRSYRLERWRDVEQPMPAGIEVRQIDADLAARVAADADSEFSDYWPDPREFAARGLGFCAIEADSGRVVSAAWSVHEPTELVEIAVGTSKGFRGRGLSPLVASRLVRECHKRGIDPRWSTDFDNIASRRVAAKLGFGHVIEHDWPLYTSFNAERRSIDLPQESTLPYHGQYTANGRTISISHDGRALRFYDDLGQTLTLAAETATRFFLREVPIQLEFTRDADGRVNGFTREQGGNRWRMERVSG